jgi:hypothetical protein
MEADLMGFVDGAERTEGKESLQVILQILV